METIQILMEEHQIILGKLNELADLIRSDKLDKTKSHFYLDFVREYVDLYHHDKEEKILFKWMVENQPDLQGGPINCMLDEHDKGRLLIQHAKLLTENLNPDSELYEKTKVELHQTLFEFIDILTMHIEKEDSILYKMAESVNQRTQNGDESMLNAINAISETHKETVSVYF